MAETNNEEELNQILKDKWTNSSRRGYITTKGCLLPENYQKVEKDFENFEVFNDDIWICSFPRTGTTWMSEMVWLIANNLDFERAKTSMFERIRFMDLSFLLYAENKSDANAIDPALSDPLIYTKSQSRPRFIKTHVPFQLLPKQIQNKQKQPKIVYIYRNPMDACTSYFHHSASILFSGNLEEFSKLFLTGKVVYGPFWEHVTSFWQVKDEQNVLILRYEEMKEDLSEVIRKTAAFLGKTLTEEQVEKLQKHLSFESMKNNPAVSRGRVLDFVKESGPAKSPFIRSGIVGGYKTEMPQSLVDTFHKWFEENREKTGLPI